MKYEVTERLLVVRTYTFDANEMCDAINADPTDELRVSVNAAQIGLILEESPELWDLAEIEAREVDSHIVSIKSLLDDEEEALR
jgi:hypothetical protein